MDSVADRRARCCGKHEKLQVEENAAGEQNQQHEPGLAAATPSGSASHLERVLRVWKMSGSDHLMSISGSSKYVQSCQCGQPESAAAVRCINEILRVFIPDRAGGIAVRIGKCYLFP